MAKELTATEALSKTIQHWTRMYCWAKCQPEKEEVWKHIMKQGIGESWFSTDCLLCTTYPAKGMEVSKIHCESCPLGIMYGRCGIHKGKNLWVRVFSAKTWGTWARAAKAFIKQLKSLT